MKPTVRSLAFCIALAAPFALQAENPIARGKVDFEPCKNHFILGSPCAISPYASWEATSDMHQARTRHTATLLNDGTVLVAGGYTASAELYDPRDRSWTVTGPLSHTRADHTATLLPSGKVLVLGNEISGLNAIDNSAEIYDPVTRQWTAAQGMQIPRVSFTATLLDTGKVLVVGGVDKFDGTVTAAELYDPESNSWAFTGHSTALFWHTATKLSDGRVLIAGGTLDDWLAEPISHAELYDPASGTFVPTGSMQSARAMHAATLLDDGSVLVTGGFLKDYLGAGGYCNFATLGSAERFDPSAGTWLPAGILNVERMAHASTLLPDGSVLLTGGEQSSGNCPQVSFGAVDAAEVLQANSSTWGQETHTQFPRYDHTATLLPDGSVLVAGGLPDSNYPIRLSQKSAELYRSIPGL